MSYAKFYSRLRDAVICVYEVPGDVIETYEQAAEFWRTMNGNPRFRSRHVDMFLRNFVML